MQNLILFFLNLLINTRLNTDFFQIIPKTRNNKTNKKQKLKFTLKLTNKKYAKYNQKLYTLYLINKRMQKLHFFLNNNYYKLLILSLFITLM